MFKQFSAAVILVTCLAPVLLFAQNYTTYYTGSPFDNQTAPEGGICMMGGASEHDEAMRWFLRRAAGGDILVLRATGSDGYNDYLYSELGIAVNSVETIVCHNAQASEESYIHNKIRSAEAIWFAGGDQWNYVAYWRNTAIDSLINAAIVNRNIVIGGTSAGMAILGKYYFTAENGTVTSETALSNPYDAAVTVDSAGFLDIEYMRDVITDTHYADRDRQGRHTVFLARILTDYAVAPKGIACNEYTAVCIDTAGLATVYGDFPNYEEAAYFLQTNCELEDFSPEVCLASQPLTWNHGGQAVRVCKVYGTNNGTNTFDVSDWETTAGGEWQNWYAVNGVLSRVVGSQIDCDGFSAGDEPSVGPDRFGLVNLYPNPFNPSTTVSFDLPYEANVSLRTYNVQGRELAQLVDGRMPAGTHHVSWNCPECATGIYLIELITGKRRFVEKAVLLR